MIPELFLTIAMILLLLLVIISFIFGMVTLLRLKEQILKLEERINTCEEVVVMMTRNCINHKK